MREIGYATTIALRNTVANDPTAIAQTLRSMPWSVTKRHPSSVGRDSVGAQDRSSLARSINGNWRQPECMLETIAALGIRTGPVWPVRLAGKFSGPEVCSLQKGDGMGKTKRGNGTKWMVVVDGQDVPLGGQSSSASPSEVGLAESTLDTISVLADHGYNSVPLCWRLRHRGLLSISLLLKNRRVCWLNDGCTLRRYRKRWKIERTFAWLTIRNPLRPQFEHV